MAEENENLLPMEALPEGRLLESIYSIGPDWGCIVEDLTHEWVVGTGPTPRAAMLDAIEAAKEAAKAK